MEHRRRPRWAGVIALVLTMVFGMSLWPVYGNELDRLRQEQQRINRQIELQQRALQTANRQINTLASELEKLERDIDRLERELELLEKQMAEAEGRVVQAERELQEAENALEERTRVFRARIKEIYLNGQVDYLEVLLQSTTLTDFLVRFELLQKIAEQDVQMLQNIEAERQAVEQKKANLEARRDDIAKLKARRERDQQRLESQVREKERLQAKLLNDKATIEKSLAEEEQAAREIAAKIRELAAKTGQYTGGKMAWPVPNYFRLTSEYGNRLHPILKTQRFHNGIDIAAPIGASVVAASDGRVIMADWLGAYGKAIVIDHGGQVSTLYAHLSQISVKEGAQVKRGQVIGKVGNTGLSTGPHLHFTVFEKDEPVSPWTYLR